MHLAFATAIRARADQANDELCHRVNVLLASPLTFGLHCVQAIVSHKRQWLAQSATDSMLRMPSLQMAKGWVKAVSCNRGDIRHAQQSMLTGNSLLEERRREICTSATGSVA